MTKIVASTIEGVAKTISWPFSWNEENQPLIPYSATSAKPTITGESESGRSTKALRKPLPRMLPRTITSAQTIPKTVLTATAITVTKRVSSKAAIVLDSVMAAQAPSRSSAVRQTIMKIGPMRMSAR